MPIFNWSGGAEVSHTTAQSYKDKVTELMELEGYILIQSSSNVAMTPDLIFRKPETEGNTDIYVETKFDDVSLSDKAFLSELASYFILYTSNKEPFDLYMYFRKVRNYSKWKQIFQFYDEATCKAFFDTLSANKEINEETRQKILQRGFETFKKFVSDTYVNQMDYQRLLMEIEERKKGKNNRTYGYEYYLRELPPIKQKQQILGNFAEIKKYSGQIFAWETYNVNYKDIYYNIQRYQPIVLKNRYLYSLESKLSDNLKQFVKEETLKTINPEDWLLEGWILEGSNKLSILQTLYKKYLLNYGVVSKGCKYDRYRSADLLFFSHADYSKSLTSVEGKQVSRLFSDTSSPFVKHEAIEIEVKIYNQRLFVFFTPTVLFTDKDKHLIKGLAVKTLHDKFSPNKYDTNLTILGDMKWWSKYLCDKKSLLETTDLLDFVGNVSPPEDSQTRDDIMATHLMEKFL